MRRYWKSVNLLGVDPLKYQTPPDTTPGEGSSELLTLKLRYKEPDGDISKLMEIPPTLAKAMIPKDTAPSLSNLSNCQRVCSSDFELFHTKDTKGLHKTRIVYVFCVISRGSRPKDRGMGLHLSGKVCIIDDIQFGQIICASRPLAPDSTLVLYYRHPSP